MIFNMSTGGASTADKIKYDNTESGLQSTNVQGAVDELNNRLTHFIKEVGTVSGTATNAEFDVTVTFNKTYQKPPKVLAIANNRAINVAVNSITETDCIIRAKYINSGTGAYSIDYFCVE